MKKIIATLAVAAIISATVSSTAFADGGRRHSHGVDVADALLWPITAALTLPAAIIGTVAQATIPHPVVYDNPPPPVYEGPAAYGGPGAYYYAPRVYVEPRVYRQPRVYYEPRGHYAPRGHYPERGYRHHRGRW